ncbi:anthrone oxygenase family protein [Agromyces litoreus]|uniref:anthrone oxygenase family protein n=1 Tax=Agromyces litoreus TaxID=3158561 RepID=UPI0033925EE5
MDLIVVGAIAAAVGAGLAAGAFFAFSAFVMPALDDLPEADAARAMRAINVAALRWPLMVELFGTALLLAVLAVADFLRPPDDLTWWVVSAAALYLLTVVLVTGRGNVPRNTALAAAPDDRSALEDAWRSFRPAWGRWNHVRTVGASATCVLLVVGLVVAA